jgi:hypothetical protein
VSSDLQARLQAALGDAYRLERELARGGMSRLFLATETLLNRQVVVKVLVAEVWRHADPELQPYVTEARQALSRLTSEPQP